MEEKYLKVVKKELVGRTFGFFEFGDTLNLVIHFTKNLSYLLCPCTGNKIPRIPDSSGKRKTEDPLPQIGIIRQSFKHGVTGLLARRIIWSFEKEEEDIKELSLEELLTAKENGFRKAAKALLKELQG